MAKLKDRLAEAMQMRDMKQIELAEKTGINKSSISQWLSGRNMPNGRNITTLSQVLNVSIPWLMGAEGDDIEVERPTEEVTAERSQTIEQQMSEMMQAFCTKKL